MRLRLNSRYLREETDGWFGASPHLTKKDCLPENSSLEEIAAGLAHAWEAYDEPDSVVLFVVQEGERNVFDQRWLQYELLKEWVSPPALSDWHG